MGHQIMKVNKKRACMFPSKLTKVYEFIDATKGKQTAALSNVNQMKECER